MVEFANKLNWEQAGAPVATGATWGDWSKTFGAGVIDIASSVPAAARWLAEKVDDPSAQFAANLAGFLADELGDVSEGIVGSMSETQQQRLSAAITSEEFWASPLANLGAQATRMAPSIIASVLPATMVSGAMAKTMAVGTAVGGLSAGSTIDDIYQMTGELDDAQLQSESAYYRGLRDFGMSEEEARKDYNQKLVGMKPALLFALGAATGVIGVPGQIVRALSGTANKAGSGLVTRVGKGAAIGGGTEFVQSGAEDLSVQSAAIEGELQDSIDNERLVEAALMGGALGGVFGAGASIPSGKRTAPAPPPPAPTAGPVTTTVPTGPVPQPAQTPVATSTPVATKPTKGKGRKKVPPAGTQVEVVAPAATNAAESEALAEAAAPVAPTVTPEPARPPITFPPPRPPITFPPAPAAVTRPPDAVPAPVVAPTTPAPVSATARPGIAPRRPFGAGAPVTPTAPRVLPDKRTEKAAAAIAKANKQAVKQNIKEMEVEELGPQGANKSRPEIEAAEKTDTVARSLFDVATLDLNTDYTTTEGKAALKGTLDGIVKSASDQGLSWKQETDRSKPFVPQRVKQGGASDHTVWLRETADLAKLLASKGFAGQRAKTRIAQYLANFSAAKETGDFANMRGDRKTEGDIAKAQKGGGVLGVEGVADTSTNAATEAEAATKEAKDDAVAKDELSPDDVTEASGTADDKDAVVTSVAKSSRGAARVDDLTTVDEEGEVIAQAAGDATKVEVTPDLNAKYTAMLAATAKKSKPELPPKVTPKVAEIKEKISAKPEPKSEPKVVTGKAKLAVEAAKTKKDPSAAEAKSGVYKKGHLTKIVPGYEVAIETAKGEVRRNKGDGPKWEVRMKHHYGHILRTKGADGDPIDVTLGPKAWPGNPLLKNMAVVVVDQKHIDGPKAGQFDEHKVFYGFDDVRHALESYVEGFSDGRGGDRFMDVRTFTPDEFTAWLDERADRPPAEVSALEREAVFETERTEQTGFGPAILPADGGDMSFTVKANIRDVAKEFGLQNTTFDRVTTGISREFLASDNPLVRAAGPLLVARIQAAAKDTPVTILPQEVYADVTKTNGAQGSPAYFDPERKIIVLNERMFSYYTPENQAQILLHEGAHAAYFYAIWENAPIRASIERVAAEARAALDTAGRDGEPFYAFANLDEFITEALSNPSMQEFLARIPASRELAAGIDANRARLIGKPIRTLWDAILHIGAKILGLPSLGHRTLLDGILQISAELELAVSQRDADALGTVNFYPKVLADRRSRELDRRMTTGPWNPASRGMDWPAQLPGRLDALWNSTALQQQVGAPWLLRLRTMDNVARAADIYFPGNNPVRKVADLIEATAVTAKRLFTADGKIITNFAELQRKHQSSGEWDKFSELVHDETETGIFADQPLNSVDNQKLTGKDTLHGPWLVKQHPELHRRWQALPPDLKAARAEAIKFYTDRQNAMAFGILKNRILKVLDINDDALAHRVFEGTQTAADEALLGDAKEVILQAKELSKIKGPYLPLMRRGEWVVRASVPITSPGNAVFLPETSEWEFKTRDEALAWGNSHGDIRPTVTSAWVDATTGNKYVTDPATGESIRITKQDANAENRFRVALQNRHVEFYDTQKEALTAAKEMETQGLETMGVVARRVDGGANADLVSHQVKDLIGSLRRRKGYKDMTPAMQNELIQALNEASVRMLGSTRIQSKRLPRTNVRGASRDLTRNMMEYSHSAAGHLAKLEHMPQLDEAMKEMRELADGDYSKGTALGRSTIAKEVEARLRDNNGHQEGRSYSPWVSRVLSLSFVDKLASVSYSMVNATQPTLLTTPVLAGKHGLARSVTALSRAYADIGAGGMVAQGFKDTARRARAPLAESTNYLADLKARVSAQEGAMFQHLADVGTIDPEGGLEIERLVPNLKKGTLGARAEGALDTSIAYLEGIARQLPKAIEAVNRSVSALAAYRLEMKRSGDHTKAVQYAQDVVNETQFNYSATNAPPLFNHPLARLAFQFKKFGLGVYQIVGGQIGKAISNANPGDRAEAIRALAYIAAMHAAAAGALGLPTEPFKFLVLGANAAGLTDYTWGDVEAEAREFAAGMFGSSAGEMITRGLPRALGVDVSGRLGLDNLMIFGEPRTDDTADVWSWFTEMAAGAPGGLMRDWHKGVGNLMDGKFVEAAETLVPVKTLADAIKAYRVTTEGKKNATTGVQTMSPYGVGEVISRVVGFTPQREAEVQERASNFYAKSGREQEQRQSFMSAWANAAPDDRLRLWGRIELFNRGKTGDEKLTRAQLNQYVKTRKTEIRTGAVRDGIRTNKRNRGYLRDTDEVYNTQ